VTPEELRTLLGQRVLLLDGGLGSLLMAAGLERGRAPEWWNLEHPERVGAAHRGYVEAGSDLIHTNSFGASPPKLRAAGLGGRCREVNARAVTIARDGAVISARLIQPSGNAVVVHVACPEDRAPLSARLRRPRLLPPLLQWQSQHVP
jgi:methionine synthase I (cobalamin-dependent)